eukprot:6938146-Pyramimonas_sp.AAC.1
MTHRLVGRAFNWLAVYCIWHPQVVAVNPSQADALDNGLEWVIIRKEVEAAVPGLPYYLAECGNAGHGTERIQTKLQTLLQIFSRGKQNFESTGDYKWAAVAQRIESTNPRLAKQVLDMTKFVD